MCVVSFSFSMGLFNEWASIIHHWDCVGVLQFHDSGVKNGVDVITPISVCVRVGGSTFLFLSFKETKKWGISGALYGKFLTGSLQAKRWNASKRLADQLL
ncbi:unnamed protein product [Tenebrio molitor]|jgi:hypothetical protein|nr:unnamed protein product [Tenebrio molitor]